MKPAACEQVERPICQRKACQDGREAHKATRQKERFVHLSLLECVAEDQASEPDQGEQNGPGSSGKQNYLCGIGKHLNPPARHA